jgi:anaerobic selenocysteine-containing dehydrogenase
VRHFKLARTTETRNTCPYCSVGCGIIMYSLGDRAKNAQSEIIHIEGDADHPVNRGTLCPKGAGLLDFVHSPNRLKYPEYRAPGSDKFVRISWDEAFAEIARRLAALVAEHGRDAVGVYLGNPNAHSLAGMLYGVAVFFFMNNVVVPLSAIGPGRFPSLPVLLNGVIGHALLVGLPAALVARRAA